MGFAPVKNQALSIIANVKVIPGIAATFIGTVVGAGFASGQEIYQFFSIHGVYGWLGLILSVLLLGFAGVKVFQSGATLKPKSYQDFLIYLLGSRFAAVMDFLLVVFFIVLIGVMFAGCGAIFETMNLNYWYGVFFTGLCLIVVLFQGLSGIIGINLVIVPLMLFGSILISFGSFHAQPVKLVTDYHGFRWILASMQFSAYNLVLAVPVLLSLGKKYRGQKVLTVSGWMGSIALGVMAGFIHGALLANHHVIEGCALPMAVLAKSTGTVVYWGYAVVLWGEMFSTLIANTYGVAQRLAAATGRSFRGWVIILTLTGIIIGNIGFVNLIARGYPLFGYICLVILVLLILKPKNRPFGTQSLN